jgi:A/G-specific adenine glycosylase
MPSATGRKEFGKKLLDWFKENQRRFPWREVGNPYYVLASEILLHRTKAGQVLPVYSEFIKRFPTIERLSSAPFDDVRQAVYSLGLNWRTERLHQMAREIVTKYNGKIPFGREELESLPGVSHYIASAVRCFAFGYSEVLLDTNTVRILGRVFGVEVTDGSRRSTRFSELYKLIIEKEHAREFNYAMIDLGALVCTPRDPQCRICPVIEMCVYGRFRNVEKC